MDVLEQKAACQQPETEKRTKDIHFIRSKAKEYKDKIHQMQVRICSVWLQLDLSGQSLSLVDLYS